MFLILSRVELPINSRRDVSYNSEIVAWGYIFLKQQHILTHYAYTHACTHSFSAASRESDGTLSSFRMLQGKIINYLDY